MRRTLEKIGRGRHSIHVIFNDFCSLAATSLHNLLQNTPIPTYSDLFQKRESEYLDITKKYNRDELNELAEALAILTSLMMNNPDDYLGRLFHLLNLHNHYKGQFFTPIHICEFMGAITVNKNDFEKTVKEKGYFSVAEPACGSGAMIIGLYNGLIREGCECVHQGLYVQATDIDSLCVKMTYVQFCILGIKARVILGNSLTNEIWESWDTPALQIDYLNKFRN